MSSPIADLGDGMVLRRATSADADQAVELVREIHRHEDGSEDTGVVLWTIDLFDRPPPGFDPSMFTIVEDTTSGVIASMLCLIPQTWAYDGIPFGVGRTEIVTTRPDYRRRGFVRAQMEEVHRWSADMGHLVQAITGIPSFYRQFGYDMALDLGGGRRGRIADIPDGPEDDPWTIRAAEPDDIPFIHAGYAAAMERYLVTCVRDEELIAHDLTDRSPGAVYARNFAVVECGGRSVGVALYTGPEQDRMYLTLCEIDPEAGIRDGTLAVLRFLKRLAGDRAHTVQLGLPPEHPAFYAAADVFSEPMRPYAWFIRVPDLSAFLHRITPAIEWHLSESPFAGHTGTVRISFYSSGIWLRFERGSLADLGEFIPDDLEDGDAAFAGQDFLHLLFGRRSTAQLREARSDCWFSDEVTRYLLDALFPSAPSMVFGVG